jgi:hypothetical protein
LVSDAFISFRFCLLLWRVSSGDRLMADNHCDGRVCTTDNRGHRQYRGLPCRFCGEVRDAIRNLLETRHAAAALKAQRNKRCPRAVHVKSEQGIV